MDRTASAAPRHNTPSNTLLPVQIVRRDLAARDVMTLWLAAPHTTNAPASYIPGQFTTLALPNGRETLYRSYSLCGDGRGDRPWEITVKRQHAGLVSTFLYERASVGDVLYASAPRGTFVLPRPIAAGMPLVFVAAGSGIAPIYGMLRALALLPSQARARVQLHYASNSPDEIIYRRELAALDPDRTWLVQWHYLAANGARLTPESVLSRAGTLARAAHWYICGPDALKRAMQGVLVRHGVPATQVHVETFSGQGSRSGAYSRPLQTSEVGAAARVRLGASGAALDARPNETLLEVLERYGYHPAFSCRAGVCGDCRLKLLAGRVGGPSGEGLTSQERAAGYVLSCVARPVGDVTLAGGDLTASAGSAPAAVALAGSHSIAKTVLRASLAAASVAVFAGTLHLTNSPSASAAGTNGSLTVPPPARQTAPPGTQGTNGGSGITTNPGVSFPNTSSGVS